MSVNEIAKNLPPYPMEELARIRRNLIAEGKIVYDFGTGDPKIPTWPPIKESIAQSIPDISQYPSILGTDQLNDAIKGYLKRRYNLTVDNHLMTLPTNGSKESVFNMALCLVGRENGKKHIIYPNPGYPVYKTSTLFAGGIPYPVDLKEENNYELRPWDLPKEVQNDTAAIWINYPHNPTGATVTSQYLKDLIAWAQQQNVVILSDDCYTDIYDISFDDNPHQRPVNIIQLGYHNIISLMSLSKRSGLTGYRSGFMIGDQKLLSDIKRARANFGVGTPTFIQAAAITAWNDDEHVKQRRKTFTDRIALASPLFENIGILKERPKATFYLWCQVPKKWQGDDIKFSLELASKGIISSPSQWLSEGIKGYVRFALVPDEPDIEKALQIIKNFIS